MTFIINIAAKSRILFLFLILISSVSFSQISNSKIQLLDQEDEMPIVGATFEYAEQLGVSDAEGFVFFNYRPGDSLIFNHTSYGTWFLNDESVTIAMEVGFIKQKARTLFFQPLTVVALRPKKDETQIFDIDNESKLAHDAGAILNRVPGFSSIRKSGGYGFDPVLRGFKYDQLNVVINGVQSATSACPNRMDPPTSQIAPNMIERIEIMKGPHSLRFGNSFGGTINFVGIVPEFSEKGDAFGRVSGNYESNGNIYRSEGLIGHRGKNYEVGLFGSWSEGDDYKDGEGAIVQSGFERGSVGANLGFKLSENQLMKLSATRNFARNADFPALAMDLREDDTWLFNAEHNWKFSGGDLRSWNTALYATSVDHLMDNLLKPLDPRMLNASTQAITQTFGGRTEGVFKFKQNDFYTGLDLRVEQAEGERERAFLLGPNAGKTLFDNVWQKSQISRSAAFAEYHFRFSKTRFTVSGRLEVNDARSGEVASEFEKVYDEINTTQINPSVSMGWINTFKEGTSLGLWLGRAQRSGSLTERFINYFPVGIDPYEMLGNPNIEPEINNQADLTFQYKTRKATFDAGLFAAYLQDYISSEIDEDLSPRLPNSPGVRQFVNINEALMTGFDLTWNQKLPAGLQSYLSAVYTYGKNQVTDEALPEIAPLDLRFSLSGNYFKNKFKPEITLRQVLKQERIATVFGETETPAFTLIDLSADYQVVKSFSIAAGVRNLLNEAYYEHLSRSVRGTNNAIYAPGRSFFVSVIYDLR